MDNKVYVIIVHTDRADRFHKVEEMLSVFGSVERIFPNTFILITDESQEKTDATIIRNSIAGFFLDVLIFVSDISESEVAWRVNPEHNNWLKKNL